LAETVLWRILTGAARTHAGGILVRDGRSLRPCLEIRKESLKQYLKEERLAWREDSSNQDHRFLRARMRTELMPTLEAIFPRAIPHLVKLALGVQDDQRGADLTDAIPGSFLGGLGLRLRRSQLESISHADQIHLPQGWRLVRDRSLAKGLETQKK
jgi:tRNA(Ile)-lysidine synthase TilS/MesJ